MLGDDTHMLSLSSFELLWVRRACCPQSLELIGISLADASKAVTLDVSEFTWHIMLVLEPRRSFLCGVEKVGIGSVVAAGRVEDAGRGYSGRVQTVAW